ncbi:SdrD B-like domain-containing protein [Methylobacillus methanolivorans]|uniref:SdrD B-like domain-containing protein n=1 Tax=Methylobacillus methanolivorans TaxID=1848927 RepID=A0ABW8GN97_9PROT
MSTKFGLNSRMGRQQPVVHTSLFRKVLFIALAMMALPALANVDVLVSSIDDSAYDPSPRGAQVRYKIQVSNNGSDPATDVMVRMSFPSANGVVMSSATMVGGSCALSGSDMECRYTSNSGNFPAGGSSDVELFVETGAATPNTIELTANITASNESAASSTSNNISTQNTTINNGADVRITSVTGAPNPVVGGGNLTWSIAGDNNGPNDASNPVVTVTLPPSLQFVSGGGGGFNPCTISGQVVTCRYPPNMAAGTTFSDLNLVTKVVDVSLGNVQITPRISSSTADPNPNNNQQSVIPPITISAGADLQITQLANTILASSQQDVTFNLQVRNAGPSPASGGVTVTHQLPTGFIYVSETVPAGWSCSQASGTVTCNYAGSYASGASSTLAIVAKAPVENAAISGDLPSTATVAAIGGMPNDPDTSNNQSVVNVRVGPDGSVLRISKERSPRPVAQGMEIRNLIRVMNDGPLAAAAGTILATDTLQTPANEEFVRYETNNGAWSCDNTTAGGTASSPALNSAVTSVSCTYAPGLAVNATSQPLVIITRAKASGTTTNQAEVACTPGSKCFPTVLLPVDVTVTAPGNSVDLAITKAANTTNANTRLEFDESTLTYTLEVRNNNAVDAVDIVVEDIIPGWRSGTTLGADTAASLASMATISGPNGSNATFSCVQVQLVQAQVNKPGVKCTQNGGVLKQGDVARFVIPVSRPLDAGSFTNIATVSSSTQGDTNTSNNTASVDVVIDPIADVEMTSKIVTPDDARAGTEVSYVLTFKNNGPSTAANVLVTDSFTIAAGDPGFTVLRIKPTGWSSGTPICSGLVVGESYGAGSNPVLSCQGGNLNDDEQRTIEVLVRPNWKTGQAEGQAWQINNTARISTSTPESTSGTDNGNNSRNVTLTIQAASVDLLVNNIDNVDPLGYDSSNGGDNPQNDVIYTINTVNNGPSVATGVHFTYSITPPSGKTIRFLGDSAVMGGSLTNSICNNIGNTVTGPSTLTVTCRFTDTEATFDNAESRNRYLTVRMLTAPPSSGDVYDSVARVIANENDNNSSNNSESETTTVNLSAPNNLSLSGNVFVDRNDDGRFDRSAGNVETGIGGVTITLSGTTAAGEDVCTVFANIRTQNGGGDLPSCVVTTDADGRYFFSSLPPSNGAGYTITETQPAGYNDGKDQVGSQGAIASVIDANLNPGTISNPGINLNSGFILNPGTDSFNVILTSSGTGYNFGEIATSSGTASISGHVWLDGDHDRQFNSASPASADVPKAGWTVELLRNGDKVAEITTGNNGAYSFTGLQPGSGYQVRFRDPASGLLWGQARPNERGLTFSDEIVDASANPKGATRTEGGLGSITLVAGDNVTEHSLPLDPAGVVYDAVTRQPVAGAVVTISGPAGFNPTTHLVSGNASQTTGSDGGYQFLLNPGFPAGIYTLAISSYPSGYLPQPSNIIPVCNATLLVAGTPDPALVQQNDLAPGVAIQPHDPASCATTSADGSFANGSGTLAAAATRYYFSFNLNGGSANVINNHIPLDPGTSGLIRIVKVTPLVNVVRGDLVPYTITATSTVDINSVDVTDRLPPGFKYRSGSASSNGVRIEPEVNGRDITWRSQAFTANETKTYKLILVVGTGVGEGQYVNQAWAQNSGGILSNIGSATVKVTPDPTFDCSDIIGKVFDDKNANGYQDQGEPGIANVRVVTARGLLVTTDAEGRFHVTCADIPNMDRGANFVMKLDERTLPSGYRVTTENPRDVRVTRGKMVKLNFGATVHRVVRLDLNDEAFVPGATDLQAQWQQAFADMVKQLDGRPSVLRVAYDPGGGGADLAKKRLDSVAKAARKLWKDTHNNNKDEAAFPLIIETAVEGQP